MKEGSVDDREKMSNSVRANNKETQGKNGGTNEGKKEGIWRRTIKDTARKEGGKGERTRNLQEGCYNLLFAV